MLLSNAHNSNNQGFTLIEMLAVIMIIGILSAIAAPSFLGMLNRNKVSSALDQVQGTLQEVQREAIRRSKRCKVGFSSSNQSMLTSNCFTSVDYTIQSSAAAASGATTVSVNSLPIAIPNGTQIVFSSGGTGMVSADAAKGSNSLTLSSGGLTNAIASGEKVLIRTLPNEVALRTNLNPSEVTFSLRGNSTIPTNQGTIVLYKSDDTNQQKKCLQISDGLGIMRTGNYSGSTTSITNDYCDKPQ